MGAHYALRVVLYEATGPMFSPVNYAVQYLSPRAFAAIRGVRMPLANLISLMNRSLESLPTPLAQLVFVASLRDFYTGRYLHEGWASVASHEEVHAFLRGLHRDVFQSVLELSLIGLTRELGGHLRSQQEFEARVARLWLDLEPFRDLLPEGSSPIEQHFFISQMRTALQILVCAPDWTALAGPDAWPPPPPGQQPPLHWTN